MKIGIIINKIKSGVISGSHFEQAILKEIDKTSHSDLEFYVFTYSDLKIVKPYFIKNIKYVSILNYENKYNKYPNSIRNKILRLILKKKFFANILKKEYARKVLNQLEISPLNSALKNNEINLCWNIFSTEMVDLPYIATCLDCYDLTHPFLPENNRMNYWLKWNEKSWNYYRRATLILASTIILKNQLQTFYGLDESKIILNPFFTPEFENIDTTFSSEKINNNPLNTDYLFYPARYTPQKNHIVIIEALKLLKQKSFYPSIIFCGLDIGNLEYLKRKVLEYQLEKQFIFLGLVDFPSLIHLYENAKALVYSSFVGPDNLPPLEAFKFNCPVIASNVSGAKEQLQDAALLFDPTDENTLADYILQVWNNEELRKTLIIKGKNLSNRLTVTNYVNIVITEIRKFSKFNRAWDFNFKYFNPND